MKLYEVFEDEKFFALVMELMTGGEVKSIMYLNDIVVVRHDIRERVLQ